MTLTADYLQGGHLGVRGNPPKTSQIVYDKFTNPVAASLTAYENAGVAGPNTTTLTIGRTGGASYNSTFDGALANGAPDFHRNVVITVTHATAVVAMTGTIYGVDRYNRPLSEAFTITAGGTTQTFTGKKAFKRVDYVSVTAAADASANTVKIGTGTVFGLSARCAVASALKETSAGAVVTTGTLVAASSAAAADSNGTYSPSTAPDGTKTYEVWYLVNDPQV